MLRFGAGRLGVQTLPVKLRASPWPVGIVTLKDRTISPVAQLFIEEVRDAANRWGSRSTEDRQRNKPSSALLAGGA
jgi:hypothetical protein